MPAYTSKDFFVELTAPDNLKDGNDIEFILKVTPMDDEVPYNASYTQLSKFNFKTECTGLSCFVNELYDPEPQTLALGAGLVMLFILAVYRRGRYDSSNANYADEIVDEEGEISEDIDEVSVDIPAPVVEDDDIELLDELDQI